MTPTSETAAAMHACSSADSLLAKYATTQEVYPDPKSDARVVPLDSVFPRGLTGVRLLKLDARA